MEVLLLLSAPRQLVIINNTFTIDWDVLSLAHFMVTNEGAVTSVWVTIIKEIRLHVISTEIMAPTFRSLEYITGTDKGISKMGRIEATYCKIST